MLLGWSIRSSVAQITDATRSLSSGSGLQYATAGILSQFTITAFEESGLRRTSGGDEFLVQLDGSQSLRGSIIDNLDGSYQATYTATISGAYEISVLLLREGGLSAEYFENVCLELATAGVQAEFSITAKDLYGNLKGQGGDTFLVRFTGVDSASGVVDDRQDGTYRVLYTLTQSGTYSCAVVFGAFGISASPFRITTQPARRN
ncbi:hypothetical protein GUITHDRAFT_78254, partial [Guillardia theta CCMP2712]